MPLDCSPGMRCSTARRLTRGVPGRDPSLFVALLARFPGTDAAFA